jgi:hypothetical protein
MLKWCYVCFVKIGAKTWEFNTNVVRIFVRNYAISRSLSELFPYKF